MNYCNQVTATIAALSLSAAGMVLAQDQDDVSEASVFEEVIVTATRREESIYEVPVAVSAFT